MQIFVEMVGDYHKFQSLVDYYAEERYMDDVDEMTYRVALECKKDIQAIYNGAKEPPLSVRRLHPWTIKLKGSTTPFKNTKKLSESVEVVKIDNAVYMVRVRPNILTDNGFEYYKVAKILEEGTEIAVTEAMRKYLRANGLFIKDSTNLIVIPKRPVWRPMAEVYSKILRARAYGIYEEKAMKAKRTKIY